MPIHTLSVTILAGVLARSSLYADDKDGKAPTKERTYTFNCTTAVGVFSPVHHDGLLSLSGISYSFSIEVDFRGGFFSRGYFDMPSGRYSKSGISVGDVTCSVDYNVNVSNLGVSAGYSYPMGKVSAYACAGTGLSFFSEPSTEKGSDGSSVAFGSYNRTYVHYNACAGVSYAVTPRISVYTEVQWFSTFAKTAFGSIPLQGGLFLLGVKTPLW